MTQSNGMPDNPGDPENTDPEATSAETSEAAAEEAAAGQGASEDAIEGQSAEFDPTLESDVDAALADIDAELADAEADSADNSVEAQLAERTEDLQRVSAEYANYRRRTERERQGVIDNAKTTVITKLLPILDDLDLAEKHGDLAEGPLKAIATKLRDTLREYKVEAFAAEGDTFDPEIHEAVQDLSSGDEKVIGTVLRKGYRADARMIRTAMVIISDPA
ncbi:heat shock protein GrpE [Corynebacterium occultum]|uniref:Protein GrpE n=1 Tax=Corynebacterium occultum TaxID=2675219 RepID=A0A6B8W711_9CORY|nr:nucleotide exchange factor GrpE [Corynebacterium occultum]QGU08421.1 heat shock protein GrpE [Corynebacterium occultum]